MAVIPVGPAGSIGIIKQVDPDELPLAAWTDGLNVRFVDNGCERVPGYLQVYDPPSIAPYYLENVIVPSGSFWVYPGLTKIYATDGSTHVNVTRQSGGVDVNYNATADKNWTGGVLGGICVLNDGVDAPQMWLPASLATKMANLTAWPVGYIAQSVRPFKQFLVALDIFDGSNRFPQAVMWSNEANPGAVPSSWDFANPAVDAGFVEGALKETTDFVVDQKTLRDVNIIYKQNSTYGMQFVQSTDIFRIYKIFDNIGALTKRAFVEFFSGQHVVFTQDDIVRHDGQQATSILDRKFRKALFSDLSPTTWMRSFAAVNWGMNEVWFCYPPRGASLCTKALVWNFREDKLSMRDLPTLAHIASGLVDFNTAVSDTWDADSGVWDLDDSVWDLSSVDPTTRRLLWADPTGVKLYGAPNGTTANSGTYGAFVERTGLGFPLNVAEPPDYTTEKSVNRWWIHIKGDLGEVLNVYLGSQENFKDLPTYHGPFSYMIGTTNSIDEVVTGRLHAIKIASTSNFDWRLTSYDVEVIARGGKK